MAYEYAKFDRGWLSTDREYEFSRSGGETI